MHTVKTEELAASKSMTTEDTPSCTLAEMAVLAATGVVTKISSAGKLEEEPVIDSDPIVCIPAHHILARREHLTKRDSGMTLSTCDDPAM